MKLCCFCSCTVCVRIRNSCAKWSWANQWCATNWCATWSCAASNDAPCVCACIRNMMCWMKLCYSACLNNSAYHHAWTHRNVPGAAVLRPWASSIFSIGPTHLSAPFKSSRQAPTLIAKPRIRLWNSVTAASKTQMRHHTIYLGKPPNPLAGTRLHCPFEYKAPVPRLPHRLW